MGELRETATRLGLAVATNPPPGLKNRVLARIHCGRRDGRAATRLFAGAAAVLLVVTLALGLVLVQHEQVGGEPVAALPAVLRAADARIVEQDSAAGTLTVVVSRQQNRFVLFADELAPVPPRRTYQVWKIGRGHRSAGLLTGQERLGLEITGIGDVHEVGITIEPAGGSRRPTGPAIVVVDVP